MDILEETVNQGYDLKFYENMRFNMKYKRTPMKFVTVFIGVYVFCQHGKYSIDLLRTAVLAD